MSVHEMSLKRWARTIQTATQHRDECIRELRAEGMSLREIAKLADLTHTAVAKILARQ